MVHYALSKRDKATMLAGARRAAEVMAPAGAHAVLARASLTYAIPPRR